jgi:translocation protein SEC63
MDVVVGTLGKSYTWESVEGPKSAREELEGLERSVSAKMGKEWSEVLKLAEVGKNGYGYERRKRALVLLYAHFLRVDIAGASLQRGAFAQSMFIYASELTFSCWMLIEQDHLLLQTPKLLNALLTISTSRNWLAPTLSVMRLHAYLTQALLPGKEQLKFAQLPGIKLDETHGETANIAQFVERLEERGDGRVKDVKRALQGWGRLKLVDASFKGRFHFFSAEH